MLVRAADASRPLLPPRFYLRDTLDVARDLLGRMLCRALPGGATLRGRIVEVEAYDGPADRASHAHRGRTQRNAPMFEAGGIAYVYLVYGVHHCLNVVTGEEGYPAAVLLRATEPPGATGRRATEPESASGPGRLCRAYAVDRSHDGASLAGPGLWLERGTPVADRDVDRGARIGVDYAGWWARRKFRFFVRGNRYVSR